MKKIVIGIDISKEKIDATAIDVRDSQLGVVKLDYQVYENRPMGYRRMLVWARHLIKGIGLEDVLFCCETTGGYDRCLCDYVYAKGLDIWREGALQIKRSMGVRKGKDDKADSLMIAEYAMRHIDKAVIYETPDENVRELKALFLYRHKLVQERTEKKVRAAELKATAAKSDAMRFIMRDAMKSIRASRSWRSSTATRTSSATTGTSTPSPASASSTQRPSSPTATTSAASPRPTRSPHTGAARHSGNGQERASTRRHTSSATPAPC